MGGDEEGQGPAQLDAGQRRPRGGVLQGREERKCTRAAVWVQLAAGSLPACERKGPTCLSTAARRQHAGISSAPPLPAPSRLPTAMPPGQRQRQRQRQRQQHPAAALLTRYSSSSNSAHLRHLVRLQCDAAADLGVRPGCHVAGLVGGRDLDAGLQQGIWRGRDGRSTVQVWCID